MRYGSEAEAGSELGLGLDSRLCLVKVKVRPVFVHQPEHGCRDAHDVQHEARRTRNGHVQVRALEAHDLQVLSQVVFVVNPFAAIQLENVSRDSCAG